MWHKKKIQHQLLYLHGYMCVFFFFLFFFLFFFFNDITCLTSEYLKNLQDIKVLRDGRWKPDVHFDILIRSNLKFALFYLLINVKKNIEIYM